MSREEANGIARAAERVRRSRLMRAPLKVVVPTAAALGAGAAVGAVAIGAIPDSNGTIHGCYLSSNPAGGQQIATDYGALRVIDPSLSNQDVPTDEYSCNSDETAISWNQQGPQGPAGAMGKQGPAGAPGQNGAAGSATIFGNTNFGITASPHVEMFLKLDGIKGESQDDKHKDAIDIESFAFGSEAPVTGSQSTGAGAGKVTVSSFSITKKLDKSTPMLERDLANGTVIKAGEVDVASAGAKTESQVASYKVTDIALKSITIKGTQVNVLGTFKALQITLGSGQHTVAVKWNSVRNTGSWNLVQNKGS
jgi:type VI secretion system secreted protein Hcp